MNLLEMMLELINFSTHVATTVLGLCIYLIHSKK